MAELYQEVASFSNLLTAFNKAFKGKRNNPEASFYFLNLEKHLFSLRHGLLSKKYKPGRYRYFTVRDPKERIISEAPFRDRVVHHALINVIEPVFENIFIENSFACRKGKGSHRAVLLVREYLKRHRFYLKLDIEKYFENINHKKLVEIIAEEIADEEVIGLIKRILKTSEQSAGVIGRGIPIGNLTSQFFANVYLNKLDHYVLKELFLPDYLRYMDDFVVFGDDKEKLKEVRDKLREYVSKELFLKAKERAVMIQRRENGIGFLGYRVFPRLIRIKNKNVRRMKRKIAFEERRFHVGEISQEHLAASVRSMIGYFKLANSRNLMRDIFYGHSKIA